MKWLSLSHIAFRACVAVALLDAGTATAQSVHDRLETLSPSVSSHDYLSPNYDTNLSLPDYGTTFSAPSYDAPSYDAQVILQPTPLDQSVATTLQGRFDSTYANIHKTGPTTWAPNAGCHWLNTAPNDFRVRCE